MRGTLEAGWGGEGGVQGVRPSFGVKFSREAELVAPEGWSGMGASEERRVARSSVHDGEQGCLESSGPASVRDSAALSSPRVSDLQ